MTMSPGSAVVPTCEAVWEPSLAGSEEECGPVGCQGKRLLLCQLTFMGCAWGFSGCSLTGLRRGCPVGASAVVDLGQGDVRDSWS